ncbi:glycoside hydrolase family 5 protein [Russula dissimulans]|nr:glycoside hydrolase family 5 protein [Russula dissimulans]
MQLLIPLLSILVFLQSSTASSPPSKIHGVNLGSWLLFESWMAPNEWQKMGGQICDQCETCISTEFALAAAFPNDVDSRFAGHWSTWFTQDDVNRLQGAGINTVRIPLGYWIVEPLVDRTTEHYPRGGIKYLVKGLEMLRKAGIRAILDHHALPGAQAVDQMFAGRCTSNPQFYTAYNYGRAFTWTAVMTFITHLHPSFADVFAIEAANEPIMDATKTPGLGGFEKNFVRTVRAMELLIGVEVSGCPALAGKASLTNLNSRLTKAHATNCLGLFTAPVVEALQQSFPMLLFITKELGWSGLTGPGFSFMDVLWQFNNPANPSAAAIGPHSYDNHIYYRFGVAAANPDAYLKDLCNRNNAQRDISAGDSPVWYGEWALSTQFTATDDFLNEWADAQKLVYSESQSAGWFFWNFKLEEGNPLGRQWSYFEGLDRGYFTQDPSKFHNPNVCVPYRKSSRRSVTPGRSHARRHH